MESGKADNRSKIYESVLHDLGRAASSEDDIKTLAFQTAKKLKLSMYEDRLLTLLVPLLQKVEAGEQVSHQEFCAWAEANLGPLCVS